MPDFEDHMWPMAFYFLVLECVMRIGLRWSPGNYLLAMRYVSGPSGPTAVVDMAAKRREHWVTLMLAVVLLNEGLKSLVRWTMWTPPIPAFGVQLSPSASAVYLIISGLLECAVAFYLFRVHRNSLYIGIVFVALSAISITLSWGYWDAWAVEMIESRRAYQGLPVREEEFALAKLLYPEGILVWLTVITLLLGVTARWTLQRDPINPLSESDHCSY